MTDDQPTCRMCPAFIWSDESIRTGLCHGCRSPGPAEVVGPPPDNTRPVGVPVSAVRYWVLDWEQIAHAVTRPQGSLIGTVCGLWMTGDEVPTPGKRGICRKCRKGLSAVRLAAG
jgi:hypothetical protein